MTVPIGILETFMAIRIISGIQPRINAIFQVVLIAVMNIPEFILVPELLLFGRFNAVLAFLLIIVIVMNEYYFRKKSIPDLSVFHLFSAALEGKEI